MGTTKRYGMALHELAGDMICTDREKRGASSLGLPIPVSIRLAEGVRVFDRSREIRPAP